MPESEKPITYPQKTVTLAWPYDVKGDGVGVKTHKPDTDVELDEHEANRLLLAGLARLPAVAVNGEKPKPIKDVLAEVGDDPEKAAAALDAEKSSEARPTLIVKLEAIVNAGKDN